MRPRWSASAAIPRSRRCSAARLLPAPAARSCCTNRTRCSAAPTGCSPRFADALALSSRRHRRASRRARARVVTGNPVRPAHRARSRGAPYAAAGRTRCGCWCSAARSARACSATSCRRRSPRCRTRCARGCAWRSSAAPEDLERVRAAYAAGRHRGRARAVLRRRRGAAGAGASGDRARRRLHRGRTRGRRAARDPGAAAERDRRPPDRERARARRGRRRLADAAARVHARGAGASGSTGCSPPARVAGRRPRRARHRCGHRRRGGAPRRPRSSRRSSLRRAPA